MSFATHLPYKEHHINVVHSEKCSEWGYTGKSPEKIIYCNILRELPLGKMSNVLKGP